MDMIEMIIVLNMNMIFYWFVVFPTLNAEKMEEFGSESLITILSLRSERHMLVCYTYQI